MSDNKIPTAEEFWDNHPKIKRLVVYDELEEEPYQVMIEFAKLHVQEALEKAGEKYKGFQTLITPNIAVAVLEDIYPLENIK